MTLAATNPTPAAVKTLACELAERRAFLAHCVGDASKPRHSSVMPSLTHFAVAAMAQRLGADVVLDLLMQPSIKELLRLGRRVGAWPLALTATTVDAVACGMYYLSVFDRDAAVALGDSELALATAAHLGLPVQIAQHCAFRHVQLHCCRRVLVLGADAAPSAVVGRRLQMTYERQRGCMVLVHWRGRGGSALVHDWAAARFVPIQCAGDPTSRLRRHSMTMLARSIDAALVFEQRGGSRMDTVLSTFRAHPCIQLDLCLYDPPVAGDLF